MVFYPNGAFAFNRASIAGIAIGLYPGWVLESTANPVIGLLDFGGTSWQRIHFLFHAGFWQPSSNTYTLDHIVTRAWNTFGYAPGEYDFASNVSFYTPSNPPCFYIEVDGGSPSVFYWFNLEPVSENFWFQLPACPENLP